MDSQMTRKAVTLVHSTERIKSRCCRAQNVGSKVATSPQWLPSCPLDSPFSRSTAKPVPLKVLSWAKNQTHLKLLMAPLRIYKSRVEADINARLLCHILFLFFLPRSPLGSKWDLALSGEHVLYMPGLYPFSAHTQGELNGYMKASAPLCWLLNIAMWSAAEGPATIVVESRVQLFSCLGHKRRLQAAYEVDFVPLFFSFYSSSLSTAKWTAFNLNAM